MKTSYVADVFRTRFGCVGVVKKGTRVVSVILGSTIKTVRKAISLRHKYTTSMKLQDCRNAINGYLSGRTQTPDLPWMLEGISRFRYKILMLTKKIPYGRTATYSSLAHNRNLARSVGSALAANPLPLIIPCHRIVKIGGTPGGFLGEKTDPTGWKRNLLELESRPKDV